MTVAYLTTRRKSILTDIIDTLTMFPYIIPGSVLGITLLLAFNEEPLLLSGTALIIIISLIIRRLPYTLRSSSARARWTVLGLTPACVARSRTLGIRVPAGQMPVTIRMRKSSTSWIQIGRESSRSMALLVLGDGKCS